MHMHEINGISMSVYILDFKRIRLIEIFMFMLWMKDWKLQCYDATPVYWLL